MTARIPESVIPHIYNSDTTRHNFQAETQTLHPEVSVVEINIYLC